MSRAWLDLGTNLDREASLRRAVELLSAHVQVKRTSHVYETAPVGYSEQPNFFNLCVEIDTALSPGELRTLLRRLEDEMGRIRTANKYGPRNIDMDLVWHEDSGEVHPQVARELFVLVPLCELAPELLHPQLGRTLQAHLATLPAAPDAVRKIPLSGFPRP